MNIRKIFSGIGMNPRVNVSTTGEVIAADDKKKEEKDTTPSVLLFMAQYWKGLPWKYRLVIAVTSISGLGTSAITAGTLALVVATIDRLIGNESGNASIPFLRYLYDFISFLGIEPRSSSFIIITIILVAVQLVIAFLTGAFSNYFISKYSEELRNKSNDKILNSSWPFFLEMSTATLFNGFLHLSTQYAGFIGNFNTLLRFIFSSLIYAVPIILISWEFGLLAVGAAVLTVPLSIIPLKQVRKIGKETSEIQQGLTQSLQKYYSNTKVVKISATEKRAGSDVSALLARQRKVGLRLGYVRSGTGSLKTVTSLGVLAGGAALGILVLNVEPTELLATILLLSRLYTNLAQSSDIFHALSISVNAGHRYTKLMDQTQMYQESAEGQEITSIEKSIELRNVSFAYKKGKTVLDNITIEIPKGKLIAFVGASGSGKTTTLDILMRLLKPSSGKILLDGQDVNKYNIKSWRRCIAYVSQGFPMFPDTIINNLKWYNPSATDEEIQKACKSSGSDFVDELKDGLETPVGGSQGIGLSGGQRQRLAIAQALLRNSDITILDESTSETDLDTEAVIYVNILREIEKGKTFIISAHRIVPTYNADLIYVFSEGKIVEKGSPQELLEQKGVYHHLWEKASRAPGKKSKKGRFQSTL